MFRSRTSDNMDRWKAEVERKKREEQKREDQRRERVRRNKMQVREKVYRKVAKHCVFPMICGSRGSKSRLAKAAGAEAAGQMRWRIAGRCGAKHISKSKCTKHHSSGPLLEVEMSKKCTPLWREAHFQVKMYKAPQLRTTFGSWDVEKVHTVVARSTFGSQNVQSTTCSSHFWTFRCRFAWQAQGIVDLVKSGQKRWGFCGISVAGAVQKTCSSELLRGPGADFLREVAFWSPRFSGLLRWFCVTGAALRMTWHHFCVAGAVV